MVDAWGNGLCWTVLWGPHIVEAHEQKRYTSPVSHRKSVQFELQKPSRKGTVLVCPSDKTSEHDRQEPGRQEKHLADEPWQLSR